MAYTDLRDFIRALEKHGELKRISFEVDPVLEIAEFADRSVKSQGPALLFEKPKGSRIPVLINSYASMRRMELALEVDSVDAIAARISEYTARHARQTTISGERPARRRGGDGDLLNPERPERGPGLRYVVGLDRRADPP